MVKCHRKWVVSSLRKYPGLQNTKKQWNWKYLKLINATLELMLAQLRILGVTLTELLYLLNDHLWLHLRLLPLQSPLQLLQNHSTKVKCMDQVWTNLKIDITNAKRINTCITTKPLQVISPTLQIFGSFLSVFNFWYFIAGYDSDHLYGNNSQRVMASIIILLIAIIISRAWIKRSFSSVTFHKYCHIFFISPLRIHYYVPFGACFKAPQSVKQASRGDQCQYWDLSNKVRELKLEMIDYLRLLYSLNSHRSATATNTNRDVPSMHDHFLLVNIDSVSNIQQSS